MAMDEDRNRLTDSALVIEARQEIQRSAWALASDPLDPDFLDNLTEALELAPQARISLERLTALPALDLPQGGDRVVPLQTARSIAGDAEAPGRRPVLRDARGYVIEEARQWRDPAAWAGEIASAAKELGSAPLDPVVARRLLTVAQEARGSANSRRKLELVVPELSEPDESPGAGAEARGPAQPADARDPHRLFSAPTNLGGVL